jgi:hypothetical protein
MASGFQRIKDIVFLRKVLFIANAYRRRFFSFIMMLAPHDCIVSRVYLFIFFDCPKKTNQKKGHAIEAIFASQNR